MNDMEQYIAEYGVPAPVPENYESQEAYQAAYNAWFDGLAAFIIRKEEEKEAARLAEEEAARRQAEEEEAARQAREEEAAQQGREEEANRLDPLDRYPVGSYVGEGPQDAKPYDPRSVGSYVDEDGNLRTADGELLSPGTTLAMEPGVDELAGEIVAEPVTGDPAIDTGLLLLDLLDALTGEEGMTSDVDGIQMAVEGIQQALEHPFMTTSFQDYNVTELWRFQRLYLYDAWDLENAANTQLVTPRGRSCWFVRNKDYAAYDTLACVGNLKKAMTAGDMMSEEEILKLQQNTQQSNMEGVSKPSRRWLKFRRQQRK